MFIKTAIVIQARMGSTRLPGKVKKTVIDHRCVLDLVFDRVFQNNCESNVILAIPMSALDDSLAQYANHHGIPVYRGSENDVLARYLGVAKDFNLDALVRITADCPLIDPEIIGQVIEAGWKGTTDYVSTEGYPRGSGDIEFVTTAALRRAEKFAGNEQYYREHVTTFILEHSAEFKITILNPPEPLARPELRLCVDESADLDVVRCIYQHFAPRTDFSLREIIDFWDAHSHVALLNRHVQQKTR